MANIDNVKIGSQQISKIFVGNNLTWQHVAPDLTAPITSVYPKNVNDQGQPITFEEAISVWFEVNEASTTYYTINGSEPTEASTVYKNPLTIDVTTTLKYFSVDKVGNKEAVKTSVFNVVTLDLTTWRYVRYQGFGDNASAATTRLVELQAVDAGGTNRLLNKLPISGEAKNAGADVAAATNGIVDMTSGTYPIWWSGSGIPTLVYDLGDQLNITKLTVYMFNTVNDPRQTKFKVAVSKNNADWYTVADYSANAIVQPSNGWNFAVAFA